MDKIPSLNWSNDDKRAASGGRESERCPQRKFNKISYFSSE